MFTCSSSSTFMSAQCLVLTLAGVSLGAVFAWISCFGDRGVGETFFSMEEKFGIIDEDEFRFLGKD